MSRHSFTILQPPTDSCYGTDSTNMNASAAMCLDCLLMIHVMSGYIGATADAVKTVYHYTAVLSILHNSFLTVCAICFANILATS